MQRNVASFYKSEAVLLNEFGQKAAFDSDRNCAVIAGPGSGKTKTLVLKVAKILNEEINDYQKVACITYSRQCCKELQQRFKKIGLSSNANLYLGTVHSFCLSQIVSPLAHLVETELPAIYSIANEKQRNDCFDSAKNHIGDAAKYCNFATMTNYRMSYLERDEHFNSNDILYANLVTNYERFLRSCGLVDFDDLILITRKLIKDYAWVRDILKAKFPIIVIDEYQDLGKPLHEIVLLLVEHGIKIIAVGDVDQSIYGFTGAHPELLLSLSERSDFEKIEMKLNYRSAQNIVNLSDGFVGAHKGVVAHHKDRVAIIDYHLCPNGLEEQVDEALKKALSCVDLLENRTLSDIAILYPDAKTGDIVAQKASEMGLFYSRIDNNAPYRKNPMTVFIEDCASWITHDWQEESKNIYLSEIIKTFTNFILNHTNDLDTSVLKLVKFLWDSKNRLHQITAEEFVTKMMNENFEVFLNETHINDDFSEVLKMQKSLKNDGVLHNINLHMLGDNRDKSNKINLITYHSSKGCEYDVVIAIGLDNGVFPRLVYDFSSYQWCYPADKELQEKRRLFFVALTRAKYDVHFFKSEYFLTSRGAKKYYGQSIFLDELDKKISS
ncbi:MAG: ATP-dependent helicase [Gammaproteobacteria bacterium]|nr:ATP-dependent helicase [Gammaproteobacteria bacterium]